jgi:hypothetical protein
MRFVALFVFFTIGSFGANAQWRWFLQAEVGANKQEIQGAYQLAQQPFDPQAFWRATAGGELQFGYTFLKVLTAYSGLGYGHQNVAYQTTEWATDDAGQSFLLLCNKTATGELLTLPLGVCNTVTAFRAACKKISTPFIREHPLPIYSVQKWAPTHKPNSIWVILPICNGTPPKELVCVQVHTAVFETSVTV